MSLPDESFEKFVVLLDRCRGQTLRQLSSPVESIVAKVFRGTLSHSASSVALDLEPVQILQKCKECPEVINLLVYASILPPQLLPTDAHR